MPKYKYEAISQDGADIVGIIEAYDEFEAIDKLKDTVRIVSTIQLAEKKKTVLNITIGSQKAKEKSLALVCAQFAIILKAGLPIVRVVELVANQTSDKQLKQLLIDTAEDVATGYGLAQSLENKGSKILPRTLLETVRAGEESGNMDVSFDRLSTYYERSSKTKAKVKSAMIYPIGLLVMATAVVAIVLVFAMPIFEETFSDMGSDLPGITQSLIDASHFLTNNVIGIIGAIAALILAIKAYGKTEDGKLRIGKFLLNIPALGVVNQMKGASQLANTMTTMLSSGLSVVHATSICGKVIDNYFLGTELGKSVAGIEEGRTMAECIKECGCFPELLIEMISVGEETGTLETMLDTVAEYYDSETALASERALSVLQPAITLVMGIAIAYVVLGLYMPIFSMYG